MMAAKIAKKTSVNVKNMSEDQIRAFVAKKRSCETKALQIVTMLLDTQVTSEELVTLLPQITQSHYEDITVERAIVDKCGYPLCDRKLEAAPPRQTYKICTRTNRVYDITERKNFCSNCCYESSVHIKNQISTSPLWLRSKETADTYEMPSNVKGKPGEAVDLSLTEKVSNSENEDRKNFVSLLDFTEMALKEMTLNDEDDKQKTSGTKLMKTDNKKNKNIPKEEKDIQYPKESTKNRDVLVSSKDDNIVNANESNARKTVKDIKKVQKSMMLGEVIERKSENRIDPIISAGQQMQKSAANKSEKQQKDSYYKKNMDCHNIGLPPAILHVEKCFGEWFSIDTLLFLFGEQKVRDLVANKSDAIKKYLDTISNEFSSSELYDQYQRLYRKLNLLELEDRKYDNEINKDQKLKPLPDYSVLKEEGKMVNLKVSAFLKGELEVPNNQHTEEMQSDGEDEQQLNIPLAEKHAQYALRKKIVLSSLDRVLPDLLKALDLSSREISGDVRQLIATFNLQAHNITFKSVQWNLIAIIVIKLLSVRSAKLSDKLGMSKANKHLELLLMSYKLDHCYLERLIWWLTDIDRLIKI